MDGRRHDPHREDRWEFAQGEVPERIPPVLVTSGFGALALVVAVAAWTPPLAWLAWVDLPLNLVLFLACAWIALLDLPVTGKTLPGVVLAAIGVAVSALHLLLDRTHPWLG